MEFFLRSHSCLCCLLFVICCLLFVVCYLLFVIFYSNNNRQLPTANCQLPSSQQTSCGKNQIF
ncbi:MAG: hypothetical protein EAZ90_20020 [Oscillatoriales cyanobacterium]|nr:MAG: hypothetical protein EAZ90_20020 [Oscillatoriales cyanobacterium]TAH26805.1 MAG: hypothetical protein EAZ10_09400 [Oscillatoriales cyanobacterium]